MLEGGAYFVPGVWKRAQVWIRGISLLREVPNSLFHELLYGEFYGVLTAGDAVETTQAGTTSLAPVSRGHTEGGEILIMVNHVWQVV